MQNPLKFELGRVEKGIRCSVEGCDEKAERSLGKEKISGLKLKAGTSRIYLCKKHYKEYKKETKKERDIEKLRWV
jgi:hypothetical protein